MTNKQRVDPRALLYAIRSNFWFVPALLTLVAIIAAYTLAELELFGHSETLSRPLDITMPIESARLILSTIAGSMITIATLVFSITLVALTLVSQQLGPRILLLFMDDRLTQLVLGLFIATFAFSLIILMRIDDSAVAGRVPGLAVVVTVLLAIVVLGVMIHFIHHIATKIQADVLIAELGRDLIRAAEKFAGREEMELAGSVEMEAIDTLFEKAKQDSLSLDESGYLRGISETDACELARESDLVLRLLVRPGEFILAGMPVLAYAVESGGSEPEDQEKEALGALISVAEKRTPEASIEFEIGALAEVALRALSPGVNDPYTAIACINRLADGMRMLMVREGEQRVSRDEDGEIRLVHVAEPLSRYLATAFDAILDAAHDKEMVLGALEKALRNLQDMAKFAEHKDALRDQVKRVARAKERT